MDTRLPLVHMFVYRPSGSKLPCCSFLCKVKRDDPGYERRNINRAIVVLGVGGGGKRRAFLVLCLFCYYYSWIIHTTESEGSITKKEMEVDLL